MSRGRRWLARVAGAWVLVALGCGPERVPPPSVPAPAPKGPADAIPADLDAAVRIDLGRIKSVLGASAVGEIEKRTAPGAAAGDTLVSDAIARADTIWIAFRPAPKSELMDSVIVLRGEFKGIEPPSYAAAPRWQSAQDLGAGWRRYDRERVATRGAPARVYARGNDVMVFASTAELDSVERRLEQGADDPHLEPSEKGVVSVAARAPALARYFDDRAPNVARMLGESQKLMLVADLDTLGLKAELEIEQDSEEAAKQTAEAAAAVAKSAAAEPGLLQRVVEGLSIEALGGKVVARLVLPTNTLAALVTCLSGGACD